VRERLADHAEKTCLLRGILGHAAPQVNAMIGAPKRLGFGSSSISTLTPVSATTSLREAGLPIGRRATERAFSDDRLAVLNLC